MTELALREVDPAEYVKRVCTYCNKPDRCHPDLETKEPCTYCGKMATTTNLSEFNLQQEEPEGEEHDEEEQDLSE